MWRYTALGAVVAVDLPNTLEVGTQRGRMSRAKLGEKASMGTWQLRLGFRNLRRGHAKDTVRAHGVQVGYFFSDGVSVERVYASLIVTGLDDPIL